GYDLTEEKSKEAFKSFKLLTDRKKEVTDDDLFTILTEEQTTTSAVEKYAVKTLQDQHGTNSIPTATGVLETPDNQVLQEARTGNGSEEATYATLEKLIAEVLELVAYQITSVGSE